MKKEGINIKWSKPLAATLRKEIDEQKRDDPTFTQDKFAGRLGISASTLTQLLNGNRNPSLDSVFSISEELGCSIDYLVGLTTVRNREWDDFDRSVQLFSEKTGLTEESLTKIIDLDFDEPYSHNHKIWLLNQIICSDGFNAFLERFNNYLVFDPDVDVLQGNEERNNLERISNKLPLPTPAMYEKYYADNLQEAALDVANTTDFRFQQYKKKMAVCDDLIQQYKNIPDSDEYFSAQSKRDFFKRKIESHERYLESVKRHKKAFEDMMEYQEYEYQQSEEDNNDGEE